MFLLDLDDPDLPARASTGAVGRARRLQAFLRPLHRAGAARAALVGRTELWVLDDRDWAKVARVPYGWPFTRTRPSPASAAHADGPTTAIVVAAEVPGRLLRRFEPLLLAAARAGVGPPVIPSGASVLEAPLVRGDARELFDLVVGHEWGHAWAVAAGLRTRVKWLDELVATTAFLAALRETDADDIARRFLAWAEVQVVGGEGAHEALPPRTPRSGEGPSSPRTGGPPRRDLGAFETPRARLRLPELAWFQGVFARRAWALVEADGWGFLLRLRAELEGLGPLVGRDSRGDVARALIAVDPSFRDWFRTFAAEK